MNDPLQIDHAAQEVETIRVPSGVTLPHIREASQRLMWSMIQRGRTPVMVEIRAYPQKRPA